MATKRTPLDSKSATLHKQRSGYITNYISNNNTKPTPEEVDAGQDFIRRLVEDYGYSKNQIEIRPEFCFFKRLLDEMYFYSPDIAVFKTNRKAQDNLFLVAECKRKERKGGVDQLKRHMDISHAEIGVWFNGQDHVYLQRIICKEGSPIYKQLPNIPRLGQRIEDIGILQRKDLKKPSNLKAIFRDLRNHLAGNVTGITRDEVLAQETINILFCKIYDEVNTRNDDIVTFRTSYGETPMKVQKRIHNLFENVKQEYGDVFDKSDLIRLDANSIVYIVGELQNYCIIEAERDAIGDAFEVFIGLALRGAEGQFFTPRNLVRMMIDMLDPEPGETILDPACGSGGFLIMALEYIWKKLEVEAKEKGWTNAMLKRKKWTIASKCLRGIDKDSFLAKVTKAYMAIVGDGRGGVFCENSLVPPEEWHPPVRNSIKLEAFDVVLTNPPFGSKIPIKGEHILSQYNLAYKWKKNKRTGTLEKIATLHDAQPPQILFLERCLQFLKPGGRLGIVLPESMLGNPSYEYVMTWILEQVKLKAVVTMPEPLFKTTGKGGTHCKACVLLLEKFKPSNGKDFDIFMADAKWCGHDSRGNPTVRRDFNGNEVLLDDVPIIAKRYQSIIKAKSLTRQDHLGFCLKFSRVKNHILVPKYYNPELAEQLDRLCKTHNLISIGNLVKEHILEIKTGVEVGKMAYGTGPISFIRTSDISNWELKADPKQGVSEEIYESFKKKLDVKAGDILMVRDGTYLIGTSAIVTASDTRILFQSHIYKIRVLKPNQLDPWLLFAAMNSPIVKKQIRARQFTQDIIDTLGNRISEIRVPIPTNIAKCKEISQITREIVETRAELRNRAKQTVLDIEGVEKIDEEDIDLLKTL